MGTAVCNHVFMPYVKMHACTSLPSCACRLCLCLGNSDAIMHWPSHGSLIKTGSGLGVCMLAT